MNRVNRLHNYNTCWGQSGWMNEAACLGLLHRAGQGALGMSRIVWMTNKADPVKPLIPSLFASRAALLRIQRLNLSACLPACLFVCILSSCPASSLLLLCSPLWLKVGFSSSWPDNQKRGDPTFRYSHSLKFRHGEKQFMCQAISPLTPFLQLDRKHCSLFI